MSLEAGEGDWSHDFSFFCVVIQLTDVGQGELYFLRGHFDINSLNVTEDHKPDYW
jgi:hypothetical protein